MSQLLDPKKYFLSIVRIAASSENFYERMKTIGVHWKSWPDCRARSLMQDFEFINAKDGYSIAAQEISLRIGSDDLYDYSDIQTGSLDEFKSQHDFHAKLGRARQLAEQIFENPLEVETLISEYKSCNKVVKTFSYEEGIIEAIRERQKSIMSGKSVVKIPGWGDLSQMIGGFNPGRVTIVSGGTGHGKTTFALNLVRHAIKEIAVLFVNMEMLSKDIMAKMICAEVDISFDDWQRATLGESAQRRVIEVSKKASELKPLILTDGRSLSLQDISSLIIDSREKSEIELVVIDYDQKIAVPDRSEEWKTLQVAIEELEEIAKVTSTHIILLSQADEHGDPKASKRMKQAASCVLHFNRAEDGEYYLIPIKNRFGAMHEAIKTSFDLRTGNIKEVGRCPRPQRQGSVSSARKARPPGPIL